MGDQAPRSRRSGTPERSRNRAGRRGPRRCRIILYVVGGLLGPGYWLCGSMSDSRPLGKSPAEVHFTEFVLASAVVVVASWGLLLILGEALLFALAVFKADDREQYDIYRNLMILWGYVLTLGIPRHFRKLPAQFEGLTDDDVRTGPRPRSQDRRSTRDRDDTRDRMIYQDGSNPRDHVGCRDRTQDWPEPWDHEDVRDSAGCRNRERAQNRPPSRDGTNARDREDTRDREETRRRSPQRGRRDAPRYRTEEREPADDRRENARDREGSGRREETQGPPRPRARDRGESRGSAASREGVPPVEHQRPLGPIFPPRPAAEGEVAPVVPVPAPDVVPPAALTAQVVATIKGAVPDAELRNALDLLLRYAACLPAGEEPAPRPTTKPVVYGITAETETEARGDA